VSYIEKNKSPGDSVILSVFRNGNVTDVKATFEYNFRLIFELWVFDQKSGKFVFGWTSGQELRCAWNQVWFNATTSR